MRAKVASVMPAVIAELESMIAIPSVAFPGFPSEPVLAMANATVAAFGKYGISAQLQEVPGGYPAVWAEIPAPEGKPTVLLYAHYDVQPAPTEQGWTADPWTPVTRDGRIYGRGAADDKSGIAIHLATLAAFGGKPPVGVKIVIEGEEETDSHLEEFVAAHPQMFQADAMIVADMGNLEVGEPTLTIGLRGHVKAIVEVRTLAADVHSGLFGGAAPDALMALIKVLAQVTDESGTCLVEGLRSDEWEGAVYTEEMAHANAGVVAGATLVGTGSVASRMWSKPSFNVLGIDVPSADAAGNVLHAHARASVGLRIPPGQNPQAAFEALKAYILKIAPADLEFSVTVDQLAPAFEQGTGGRAFRAMTEALATAYGKPVGTIGSGGSIPLLDALKNASPHADFVLSGAEDTAKARIHGPDESVDPSEIEHMALAQALMLQKLAE
jgi:acetylornithine deacetylase/succinyl-diaminopimelate desuccinylase-like protein